MENHNGNGDGREGSPPRGRQRASDYLDEMLLRCGKGGPGLRLTEDHMLSVLFVRRARSTILGHDLFSDPAWDILLELYAAKLGQRTISPEDLARATATPESTTRRWIGALTDCGLARCDSDETRDAAATSVSLTSEGASKMERLADYWGSAFTSI